MMSVCVCVGGRDGEQERLCSNPDQPPNHSLPHGASAGATEADASYRAAVAVVRECCPYDGTAVPLITGWLFAQVQSVRDGEGIPLPLCRQY